MSDLISIVIPTYNGEKYIKECIESIQKQNMNTEIIVVDDISTDKTVDRNQRRIVLWLCMSVVKAG